MSGFDSLTTALEGMYDKPLRDLPKDLQKRIEQDFSPMPWDDLSPDQRRSVAQQWDYQNDPATEQDRQFWWDFLVRKDAIEKQIAEWKAVATPTASELAQKEDRLGELEKELARMERQQHRARPGQDPVLRSPVGERQRTIDTLASARFIPYPRALKQLADRLNALPDELAAWVWMGPDNGGLAAYLNANELEPPPRFYYDYLGEGQSFDYLGPLMGCWFRADKIAGFEPTDRFISGKALIERWGKHPGIQPEAFIRAKIAESRLLDTHPIFGGTQGAYPEDTSLPPIENGLFVLSHVEEIEASDFGADRDGTPDTSVTRPAEPPIGSREWRIQNARAAANARHNQPGGSRDKQKQIRDIWATGKYSSRDICAEQECAALEMSFTAARNALKKTPDPLPPGRC